MTLPLLSVKDRVAQHRPMMKLQAMGDDVANNGQHKHFDCQSSHARLQRSNSQRGNVSRRTTPTFRSKKTPIQTDMMWTVHDATAARTPKGHGSLLREAKFSPPSAASSPTGSDPESFLDTILAAHRENGTITESANENVLDSPSAVNDSVPLPRRGLLRAPSLADIHVPPPPPPENDSDDGSDESDVISFAGESQGGSDHEWSDIEDGHANKQVKNINNKGWDVPPALGRSVTADGRIEESVSPATRRSITKRLLQKVNSIGKHAGALAWGSSTHGRVESSGIAKKSPRFSRKLTKAFEEMESSASSDNDEDPLIKSNGHDMEAPLIPSHEDIMMMNNEVFIEELPLAAAGRSSSCGKLQPCLSPGSSANSTGYRSPKYEAPPVSERLMKRLGMNDDRMRQSYHGCLSPHASNRQDRQWSTDALRGGMSSHARLPTQSGKNRAKDQARLRSKSPPPSSNNLAKVGEVDELPLNIGGGTSSHARLGGSNRSSRSGSFLQRPVKVVSSSAGKGAPSQDEESLHNDGSLSSLFRLQDCGGSSRSLQDSFLVRPTTPTSPFMIQRLKVATIASKEDLCLPYSQGNESNRSRTLSSRSSKTLPQYGTRRDKEGSRHHGSSDSLRSKSSHGRRIDVSSNDNSRSKVREERLAFTLGASSHARLQSVMTDPHARGPPLNRQSTSDRLGARLGVDHEGKPGMPLRDETTSEPRQLSSSRHSTHGKHSFRSQSSRPTINVAGSMSPKGGGSLHSRLKKAKKPLAENKKNSKEKKLLDPVLSKSGERIEGMTSALESELFECLKSSRRPIAKKGSPTAAKKSSPKTAARKSSSKSMSAMTTEEEVTNHGHDEVRDDASKPEFTLEFNKSDSDMSADESKTAADDMYLQLCLTSNNDKVQVVEQHVQLEEANKSNSSDAFVQFCWSNAQSEMANDREKLLENYKNSQVPI